MKDLKLNTILLRCINEIGDYFEYCHESEKDKEVVMRKIEDMNRDLKVLYGKGEN